MFGVVLRVEFEENCSYLFSIGLLLSEGDIVFLAKMYIVEGSNDTRANC